jgi:class 3 adenylate cyclase
MRSGMKNEGDLTSGYVKQETDIAKRREAVILFADLMNSSELANNQSLIDYDRFVAIFQKELGEVVEQFVQTKTGYQPGEIEADIRGDEICLKLYRAADRQSPQLLEDVDAALQVAIQMKRKWLLSPINRERIVEGRPAFEIGIGIHQGPVLLTEHHRFVPATIETTSHKSDSHVVLMERLTPEGHAINLAKRIEARSRQLRFSQILVSHNVFNLVDPDFRVAFRRARVGPFKGISQSIPVYEAIGIGHFDDQAFRPRFGRDELEVYEEALKSNPDMIWLLLDLGHHYFDDDDDKDNYEKSAEKYQQVINIIPDFGPAHMYLGRCWFRRYHYEEAKYSLERALEINELSPRTNSFLAVCLRRLAYRYRSEARPGWKDFFIRALDLHDRARRIATPKKGAQWDSAYLWALNGLARTIAEAGDKARGHFSLDDAESFAEEALGLVREFRENSRSKGLEIDKEHLVRHTLGCVYLKRCEETKFGKHEWGDLRSETEDAFRKAIEALERRNRTCEMGKKNYHEKLAEIRFHLALLSKACKDQKRLEEQVKSAMDTGMEVGKKFLEDQYWYDEAAALLKH